MPLVGIFSSKFMYCGLLVCLDFVCVGFCFVFVGLGLSVLFFFFHL